MGDRVLIQLEQHPTYGQIVSPVLYMHWGGNLVPKLIVDWYHYMEGRRGDMFYAFARLTGIAHEMVSGNLSLGVWQTGYAIDGEDSHGDAGVFRIHVQEETIYMGGGYGVNGFRESVRPLPEVFEELQ